MPPKASINLDIPFEKGPVALKRNTGSDFSSKIECSKKKNVE